MRFKIAAVLIPLCLVLFVGTFFVSELPPSPPQVAFMLLAVVMAVITGIFIWPKE